jgi:hypothetical protein
MDNQKSQFILFKYRFEFEDGTSKKIELKLDNNSLDLITGTDKTAPEWAMQKNFNCPVTSCVDTHPEVCPIAVNLKYVIDSFYGIPSYKKVKVHETDGKISPAVFYH